MKTKFISKLFLWLLLAAAAHAQIDVMQVIDSSDAVIKTWGGGKVTFKCGSGLGCSFAGGKLLFTVGGSTSPNGEGTLQLGSAAATLPSWIKIYGGDAAANAEPPYIAFFTSPAAAAAVYFFPGSASDCFLSNIVAPTLDGTNCFMKHSFTARQNMVQTLGNFTITRSFGAATGAGVDMDTTADTTGNTGTGYLMNRNTASGSAAKVFRFTWQGTANGVQMGNSAFMGSLGNGGIDSSMKYADVTDTTKTFIYDISNITTATQRTVTVPNAASTFAQPKTCPGSQWMSLLSSVGLITCTQPAFTDISGAAVSGQTPIATTGARGAVIPRGNLLVDGSGNLDFTPGDPDVFWMYEEFSSGAQNSTTAIGTNGWSFGTIVAAPTASAQAGVFPHLGVERLASVATTGDGGSMFLSNLGTIMPLGDLKTNVNWQMTWIFKLIQTTNTSFRIGFADSTTAFQPNNGCWLRYDTFTGFTDSAFNVECRAASTSTVGGTTYTVDTGWHKVVISSTVSGSVVFTLDANTPQTIATNVPTAGVVPLVIIGNQQAAVSDTVDLDMFAFKMRGLAR